MKVVVFSGAGMSAESGINTFRGSEGLWENHSIYDVATPEAWERNPELVLEFYNQRRKTVLNSKPNLGHTLLAQSEKDFDITIITQNIDDLHERAGSSKVIHLHGEIRKSQSSFDEKLVNDIEGEHLGLGELCSLGSQLRPQVVWFGEEVPMLSVAAEVISQCEGIIVIGTSLKVYPAAGLLDFLQETAIRMIIDPQLPTTSSEWIHFESGAVVGVESALKYLEKQKARKS
ncbi:MAG: NAD-dependent deacetylase [Sphingobacteriales bacterium]|jgi:NAD-dependent deacetylase